MHNQILLSLLGISLIAFLITIYLYVRNKYVLKIMLYWIDKDSPEHNKHSYNYRLYNEWYKWNYK